MYESVNAIGLIQGILLAIGILFYPKGNRVSNLYLAFHVFFSAIVLASPFTHIFFSSITLSGECFVEPFLLLIFPFLYLYIKSFTQKINGKIVLIHLLSFILYCPLLVFLIIYKTPVNTYFQFDMVLIVLGVVKIFLFAYYLVKCWKEINLLQALVKQNFSEVSRKNLKWVKQLVICGCLILLIYSTVMTFIIINPEFSYLNLLLIGVVTIYIYFASFKGLTQPAIFVSLNNYVYESTNEYQNESIPVKAELEGNSAVNDKVKYEKSTLTNEKQEKLIDSLEKIVQNEKLYLEPELSIQILAGKLNTSPYYISQVLNQNLKTNFYDYINSQRVERAKELLTASTHKNLTILAIGFEAGFNSKTTFNTVFKKFTGKTPSVYKSENAS